MAEKFTINIPSEFSLTEDSRVNNSSFHPVKLRIMSSGKNYNFSDIIKDGLDNAKGTVAYAPILANIITREDGELDANGHDIDYQMNIDYKGNVTLKENYIEKPVGVFVENAVGVKYDEDENVHYLESLGFIWKNYSDMYDILKRDEVKDVSVEIEVTDGAYRDSDGYYEIRKFNILGCTILGNGLQPAIENSRIEFSVNENKDYQDSLEELKILLQNFSKKEGVDMENNKDFEQDTKDNSEDNETCSECGKDLDECICDEDKEKENEDFSQDDNTDQTEEKIYTQSDLDKAIADTKAEFSEDLTELANLRKFKVQYDKEVGLQQLNDSIDKLLVNFNIDEDVVKGLREKVVSGEYSLEKFELELFRNNSSIKNNFSKDSKCNTLPIVDTDTKISEVDKLFAKYGI